MDRQYPDYDSARFAKDAADHQMVVLHDDGLYRHLRFRRQVWRPPLAQPLNSGAYWFDLITVPGTLIYQGDGQSFVFRRLDDMFEFFRMPSGGRSQINPGYWAEKLVSGRDGVLTYSEEEFKARVVEAFVDCARHEGVPAGTGKALREEVLDDPDIYYESGAREVLEVFEFKGFQFSDTEEWDFRQYDWWFLWACHAIVWGIDQYDQSKTIAAAA